MRSKNDLLGAAAAVAAAIAACTGLPAGARADAPSIKFNTDLESDYIYRGITLSAHRPSITGGVELQHDWFYVSGEISSVKLPAAPAAEVVGGAGIRQKFFDGKFEIDVGIRRYLYPGATPVDATGSSAYTEGAVLTKTTFDPFTINTEVAYAPNYANIGARAFHISAGVSLDMPKLSWLPADWYVLGEVGRVQFGTVSAELGGYKLPDYTHWTLGLGFTKEPFTLEFNFSDTTLSREDCFLQTGDPSASPGGAMTDLNPLGLRSAWCGPAFIAKLSVETTRKLR